MKSPRLRRHVTFSNVIAVLALFLALSGISYAAGLHANSVGTAQLKSNAVISSKVKNNSLTGMDINESKLDTVPAATRQLGEHYSGIRKVTASSGVDANTAQAAAVAVPLVTVGSFQVYGKCYKQADTGDVHADIFIKSLAAGAVVDSNNNDFAGNPFLDPTTLEANRELQNTTTATNSASTSSGTHQDFYAVSAAGQYVSGNLVADSKAGVLPGGDGIYGAGDRCILAADVHSSTAAF